MKFLKLASVAIYLIISISCLTACSGGGGSDPSNISTPENLTGVFLDSPVEGIRYTSLSNTGVTNSDGEFQYKAGEVIELYVGNIYLGQVLAAPVITPMDLFPTAASINDNRVTNVLRLLQSLDVDGITGNGIQLPANIQNVSNNTTEYVDFSVSPSDFEQNTRIQQMLLDSNVTSLVSAGIAQADFSNNIAQLFGVENVSAAGSTNNCEGSNYPCIPGTTSAIEPVLITAVGFPMERGVETATPGYDYIIHSGPTHTTINPLSRNLHLFAATYPDTYNIKDFASELGVGVVSFYTDDVEGGDGSYLYVDGQLVGDLPENSPYISGPGLSDCGYMHDSQIRTIVLPPGVYNYEADTYTSKQCVGVTTADPFLCPDGAADLIMTWAGTFEVSVGSCQMINAQGVPAPSGNLIPNFTYNVNGYNVNLDASGSTALQSTIIDYSWQATGGYSANGKITFIAFMSPGSYEVTLTVTDDSGATESTTKTILINEQTECVSGESETRSCTVTNGTGYETRACNIDTWGSYSSCQATSCNFGYEISGDSCVAETTAECVSGDTETRSCFVSNGVGSETRSCNTDTWGSYSSCQATSCLSGYVLSGNSCVLAEIEYSLVGNWCRTDNTICKNILSGTDYASVSWVDSATADRYNISIEDLAWKNITKVAPNEYEYEHKTWWSDGTISWSNKSLNIIDAMTIVDTDSYTYVKQ